MMENLWSYIGYLVGIITIILTFISFGEKIAKFFKRVFNKNREKVFKKIFEWYKFIDRNLTEEGLNQIELDHFEKEIDFLFSISKNARSQLNFSKKFMDDYLKFCGIKKEYRTKENFIKYAHIKHGNLKIILDLDSHLQKRKITELNISFNTFWNILRGNFHVFYKQYLDKWNGIPDEERLKFADIEMPIKLLRIYFGLDKKSYA